MSKRTPSRAGRATTSGSERSISIAGVRVAPGRQRKFEIPVARLFTHDWASLPVCVLHGIERGPAIWVSAALHGDELNGVEIVRELVEAIDPENLRGTVIAIPIVNTFGFLQGSRYLPDRRDLNRSFPGSERGSLASRLAHLFMTEIVRHCDYGIDLHTASLQRTNLPQVRADRSHAETARIARAFGAPVLLDARLRKGSLRSAAARLGIPILLYEAGENLRMDPDAIATGLRGCLQVLNELDMIDDRPEARQETRFEAARSSWIRARRSGILRLDVELGERVERRRRLGSIGDVFGDNSIAVRSPVEGVIIGHTNNPLVYQGDAVAHVAIAEVPSASETTGKEERP